MRKVVNLILVGLFFSLLSITNVWANHADSFPTNQPHSQQNIEYDGTDMVKFVFLQKAQQRKEQLLQSIDRWPEQQALIIHNMTNDRGFGGLFSLLSIFLLILGSGYFVERLFSFKMNLTCNRIAAEKESSWGDSLSFTLMRGAFDLLSLGVFALVCGAFAVYMYEGNDPFRLLSLQGIALILKIRVVAIFLNIIFAPYAAGQRLIPLERHAARRLYYWILGFISLYYIITTFWRVLAHFELEPIMFAMLVPISGLILNVASVCFVWFNRKNITRMFTSKTLHESSVTQVFSQIWPTIITFWLIVIWTIWAANEFLGNYQQAEQLTPAWWLTFSFPILDRIIFVLLSQLKRISWLQSHSFEQRCDVFISRVIIAIRVILLAVVVYLIDSSFGYNAWEMLASQFGGYLKKSVDVVIVIILAYAAWEAIQSAIERHLPIEMAVEKENGLSSLEGDGGGAGASRSETLLPLVRSFLLVFLLVSVTLTVLSIVGVEIAPLLAGAGIVGIAVGFGAQKLVQDVISGIFFLLDDAFRRGEYIEAAGLRGTVERISIRSIRLRHHLGAVQTIPFSEIATVRNLSRDWITMKLEFRLSYQTDVEKVRKLIKKVGQKMLLHPEYGQHFLLPLKSQGVIRVEESALIFRMKFTCIPGEQWLIRRDAFRLVKDALESNGIEFAHRSVHVLMQQGEQQSFKETTEQTADVALQRAGAAAITAATAASARRNSKIDDEDDLLSPSSE
ncbi:MAG: mechanosensitive ion channel family protein [Pseudomonadales bacterium]|nr:mechanosensitive ion channel family protein [Pseudomonadales bacterium]